MRANHAALGIRGYLQVLHRRKWIIVQALVLVPLAAVYFSLNQERVYQASSEVVLQHQSLASILSGIPEGADVGRDATSVAWAQGRIARAPIFVERVLRTVGVEGRTAEEFLDASVVLVDQNADVLEFRVRDGDRELATRLAAAYAKEFIARRLEFDAQAGELVRREVRERIEALERQGRENTIVHDQLVQSERQLQTLETPPTSNASLLRAAGVAKQVEPKVLRNGLIGVFLGLLLGGGLAFFHTRIRSAEAIGEALGVPLLGLIPGFSRRQRDKGVIALLESPVGPQAEAFRVLRTNFDSVNLDHGARTVMVTSAFEQEGKSTTAANLAVAIARSGRRVAVVDVDLRAPLQDVVFGTELQPGLTEVVLGHATLDEALMDVPFGHEGAYPSTSRASENGVVPPEGFVAVLASGLLPPKPGEFIASGALERVLDELRERFDVVVLDVPPLLQVSDPLALSAHTDGVVLVTRLGLIRRPTLRELKRLLSTLPVPILGFVVTGVEVDHGYGYGHGSKGSHRPTAAPTSEGQVR